MDEMERLRQENIALKLACQAQQEINQYKELFLTRIAHELRSPLSSLISLQQLILHGLCNNAAEEKKFLTDAHTAAHHLLAMIDDVVTVAKIDYGQESLVISPIQLDLLLEELHSQVHLPVGNQNLSLRISYPSPELWVHGDRHKLLWVLRNLIEACLQNTEAWTGAITLHTQSLLETQQITLALHLPCPEEIWHEITATDGKNENPNIVSRLDHNKLSVTLSAATRWQLCYKILNKMHGSLSLTTPIPGQTLVIITLPMAIGNP